MREHEASEDDLDIEIIDLDAPSSRDAAARPTQQAPVHVPRKSSHSKRQHLLRVSVTVAIVGVALFIILANSAPLYRWLPGLTTAPGATANTSILAGGDSFYIDASPLWGRLSIDGNPLKHVPIWGKDAPVRLTPGQHHIVWQAEPFQPLHCTVSVPVDHSDTCHYMSAQEYNFGPTPVKIVPNSWQLMLYDSLAMLSPGQRNALTQASQAALDAEQSTETVYPGERYVHMQGKSSIVDIARQPLLATLHYQLDTGGPNSSCAQNPGQCSFPRGMTGFQTQNCLLFCTFREQGVYSQDNSWSAIAITNSLWDYATLDGHTVFRNQSVVIPGTAPTLGLGALLKITWVGGNWHVVTGDSHLACISAGSIAFNMLQSSGGGFGLATTSGVVNADGCLIRLQMNQDSPTP
ncbi:MAG TPA: hypothetical protein VEU97_00065, partial [Ktedonobacteraceae bacterium]|nr:hypothetical protein [Ktedonobacteraceae bacterium]